MDDVTKRAVKFARQEYANAKYDGENDIIVTDPEKTGARTFEFTIEGNSFPFIEYGSGTRSGNGYSTTKPYWFFSGKGRNIELKAGGALAHMTYIKRTRTIKGFEIESAPDEWERFVVKPYMVENKTFDLKKRTYTDQLGDVYRVRPAIFNKKTAPYTYDAGEKLNSYITKGNPPVNAIPQIRKMIEEEMLGQFEAKFK